MLDKPLVSVIINAFNHEKYIEQAMMSVLNQTYANIELIVIDDGSTDSTRDRISKVIQKTGSDKIRYYTQENIGITRTLNRALRMSRGDYVTFLGSDDAYLPTKVEESVKVMLAAEPGVMVVYTDGYIINGEGRILQRYSECMAPPLGNNAYKELLLRNWIAALSILYRKSVFDEVGLFDESHPVEDYDMLLRISRLHHRFVYIHKELFYYRRHEANYSNRLEMLEQWVNQIKTKNKDLRKYKNFKRALKSGRLLDVLANMNLLNIELLFRLAISKVQQKYYIVNVGFGRFAVLAIQRAFSECARQMARLM